MKSSLATSSLRKYFFHNLPVDRVYTFGLDEPSSWLVRLREARYDLNSIQLGVFSGDTVLRLFMSLIT